MTNWFRFSLKTNNLHKMSSVAQSRNLSSYIGGFQTVFRVRLNCSNQTSICNYSSRKSAEERLGINKPKRPLTPFFKFLAQIRPGLLAKNSGITYKEVIELSSKQWQQLDAKTKTQMSMDYQKDLEDYRKIKALYESSLTDEQKENIKKVKEELVATKEKRKLKTEYKEMGRPKKPMSSYFLFAQTKKESFKSNNLKEYQENVRTQWFSLPETEKLKYEKQAQQLMEEYKKDLKAWELKMLSLGRFDLVGTKLDHGKKHIAVKKNL